jgi:hypothetical protein
MRITALLGGATLGALVVLGLAVAPASAAELPARGGPDNCAQLPMGSAGCEDHMGAAIRARLVTPNNPRPLADVSDFRLGQVGMALCFNQTELAVSQTNPADRPIVFNLSSIRAVTVPALCG